MQRAFDLIVERLEKKRNASDTKFDNVIEMNAYDDGVDDAIEIVNQVASEYGGGWIPVSSGKLPEEHESIFASYKGTKKWDDAMFEKISNEVNVTVADKKGKGVTTCAHTEDGKWCCDLLRVNKSYRIIAWQPLPEPYKPKFEFECANPASPELIREVHDKLRKIEPEMAESEE